MSDDQTSLNRAMTVDERLMRIEVLLQEDLKRQRRMGREQEKLKHALQGRVTHDECNRRHPPQKPLIERLQQYLGLILLIAALLGGYLALHHLEIRPAQPAASAPAAPAPAPAAQAPADAGGR